MNSLTQSYKRSSRNLRRQVAYIFSHYKWLIVNKTQLLGRKFTYLFRIFSADSEFRSQNGRRFLELNYLLKDFLTSYIKNDSEYASLIASQLLNVLKHCDEITYEEQGTAEAYALLHFLDRYHRFQIIFDNLNSHHIMPIKSKRIDILDVGTGPGPSMYAISDFYTNLHKVSAAQRLTDDSDKLSIDYVERSRRFRNWLHHFTEHVNYYCPSQKPWKVPFHHGTFHDFEGLEFNQRITFNDQDDDGEFVTRSYIEKHRFDVIIFSNFLTTKEQVVNYSDELRNCVRFLRNNGILVIVGAKSQSAKYNAIYEEISQVILSENYSNWKFIAKCEKLVFENSTMGYSWSDCYGTTIKELIKDIYGKLQINNASSIPLEMVKILNDTIQPSYSRPIEWEVHVFRKKARMRKIKPNTA